ncbi:hypothetical protein KFK09_004284 [Dendrobium nobile]|uniref:BED-type domain-containing protein n=1 Tax=Dendrobium nobile TaxID=94219 RepID=A0A8T3C2G3_DENNO|nr:hypothetical protein KFK09_004284 [Dendrobium nobile]
MSALKVPLVAGQQRSKAKKVKVDKMLALLPAKSEQADMNSIGLNDQNHPIDNIVEGGNDIVALETEINATPISMSGKRKRRSVVWGYFELLPSGKDERQRCKCRNCGTSYLYDSKFGTGNMKRHLVNCLKRVACDTGPLLLTQFDSSMPSPAPKFDHEKFKDLLTEAVILHDLPFQFVEWEGIRSLLLQLHSNLQLGNRNTVGVDCIEIHRREKAKVQILLEETPSRVSFTYDLWSSLTSDVYICLTAHFIDKDWNLQKKILNFSFMPPPCGDIYIAEKIYNFLIEWGLDKRVSTFTVNGANAAPIELLKDQLNSYKGLLCEGAFFHLDCCAHVIDLIVREGLKEIEYAIKKVRESIKYVKASPTRKQKFLECVNHSSLEDKRGLKQDVSTWWSSTFIMLKSAIYYRRAFLHLELIDSNYKECPSNSDWDKIEKIEKLLAVFHEISNLFSNAKYTTANLYFPVVFSAYLTFREEMGSDDEYLRSMATLLFSKFERYWSDFHILLVIAVILDPRYKFSFVEWCYKKLYDDAGVIESMKVREKLFSLFSEYISTNKLLPGPKTSSTSDAAIYDGSQGNFKASENSFSKENTDLFREFDSFESEEAISQKSQLELYLDEPRLDRKSRLDILAYWRGNQFRYPEVAAMARDILSIPVSAITMDNAFDANGRVLDQYYSALKPDILEAFICTRDWFYGENDMTRGTLEDLTKNILELNDDDRMELPECSNSVNIHC